MAKENAVLDKKKQLNEDLTESFDFDELEEKKKSEVRITWVMLSWMLCGSNF